MWAEEGVDWNSFCRQKQPWSPVNIQKERQLAIQFPYARRRTVRFIILQNMLILF